MKYLMMVLLAIFATALLVSCASDSASTSENAPAGCEACAAGKSGEAVWCDACGVGYLEGAKVKCKGCYAAKTGGPECPSCK